MNIICIWHNAPVMLLNKTANSVLHDILHRIYQRNLYFLNIIWFQGTRAKIMSCRPVRKVWHSMCQFSRKSCMLNSITFRSHTKIHPTGQYMWKSTDRKSYTPPSKVWLPMFRLSQKLKITHYIFVDFPCTKFYPH